MYKKSIATTILGLVLVTGVGFSHGDSALAMEPSSKLEEVNLVADDVLDEVFLSEATLPEITPFATFNIGTSNLKPNYYIKSSSSYYIKKGEKVKVNSVTWSPSGQKIKLGFVSATGGSNYWTTSYVGGSKTGGSFNLGGPTGEYYIAILADSNNNANLSTVSGSFDF